MVYLCYLQDNLMINSSIIMLRRVRRIMRTEGQWCIRYVPREFNEIANCLTELSLVGKSSLQIYDGAPNEKEKATTPKLQRHLQIRNPRP
ncbi:hypothetical protein Gohar_005368, partial [Gossypium harknessii]|nr:hypothetical protein [Gossypium harknessii]